PVSPAPLYTYAYPFDLNSIVSPSPTNTSRTGSSSVFEVVFTTSNHLFERIIFKAVSRPILSTVSLLQDDSPTKIIATNKNTKFRNVYMHTFINHTNIKITRRNIHV